MRTIKQFHTSLDVDTPWGNLQFSGIVEHDRGHIHSITAHYGGADYERVEAAIGCRDGSQPSPSSSPLARALWPLLIAEITAAHRDSDLAKEFSISEAFMARANKGVGVQMNTRGYDPFTDWNLNKHD